MSYFVSCPICGYVRLSNESNCPVETMDQPSVSSVFRVLWQNHKNHAMTKQVESVECEEMTPSDEFRDLLDRFIDYRTTRSFGTTEMRTLLAGQMIFALGKALAPPRQVKGAVRLSEEDMNPLMKGASQGPMLPVKATRERVVFHESDFRQINHGLKLGLTLTQCAEISECLQDWLDVRLEQGENHRSVK